MGMVGGVSTDEAERIVELLRRDGGRMTQARQIVVEAIVQRNDHHFTAPEVIDAVRERNPAFPESTVYRTLDRLLDLGVLTALLLTPGTTTFHLSSRSHHHLVCRSCGAVAEADADLFDDVAARLALAGFTLDRGLAATLHGWCSRCRATSRSRRPSPR